MMDPSIEVLQTVFAGEDSLARAVSGQGPFATGDAVIAAAAAALRASSRSQQVEMLNRHPRLGLAPDQLHGLSRTEQHGGLEPDEPLARELRDANDRYEARFGFRFVTFVNGRPLSEIPVEIASRLDRPPDEELRTALDAYLAIARHRLQREGVR